MTDDRVAMSPSEKLAAETYAAGYVAGILFVHGVIDNLEPGEPDPSIQWFRIPGLSPTVRWRMAINIDGET